MERVKIKVARVGPGDSELSLPRYMTDHASGADLFAAPEHTMVVKPGERIIVPTGIAVSIPPGYEAQIRPRSGLALKHGVTLLNTPGTIDADYRGEIRLIVINHGDKPFKVERGDRLAQMVICQAFQADFALVEELDVTTRNAGGFGHTGK